MASWVYDDLVWWANVVHRSCATEGILGSMWNQDAVQSCFSLEGVSTFYTNTLRLLAGGTAPTQGAAALLFRAKALKKWRLADPSSSEVRRKAALQGFIERNYAAAGTCRIPRYLREEMRRLLKYWLPEPERLGWTWTGAFGPGACAEKWSRIKRLEHLLSWTRHGFSWPDVPPNDGDAKHVVARAHAVPKDYDKDRLITIEPAYGTFAQAYLREALQCSIHAGPLQGTAMDLQFVDSQSVQRGLALKASENKGLATIDLKDASDRISVEDVLCVFPSWVCALIDVTRSTRFKIDEDVGSYRAGDEFLMNIYAGMGNGSTFTIETLFFTAFVVAYAEYYGYKPFCSTFGDDVICHSAVARRLMEEQFDCFFVNKDKSFMADDALRESCGIFAYKGVDITAPKVDGYLNNVEGRLGLVDLWKRLYTSPWAYGPRLSYSIASVGALVNWPSVAEGYPSISDPRFPYSPLPELRTNILLQRTEARLPVLVTPQPSYPTDWKAARAFNTPDPQVLLQAALAGMLTPRTWTIGKRSAKRRWSVTVPERAKPRLQRKWVSFEPSSLEGGTPACVR